MTNLHFLVLEDLTKPLYICNEDRPYYATQYQDNFDQYQEGFYFITGKRSAELKDVQMTILNGAPEITPYTQADICNGYVIPHETPVYPKPKKYELFREQIWFGAVNPNVQIVANLDYIFSRVLLELDHTSLSIYKKF